MNGSLFFDYSRRFSRGLFAALVLWCCDADLLGQSVTFRFTGKVRSVAAELGNEVKVGDSCSVEVTFDQDTDPVFAGLPWYPVLSSSFTIHAAGGDLTASSTEGPQERIVVNDRQGAFQADQWLWGAGSGDGFGGKVATFKLFSIGDQEILDYNIHLTDNTATAFSTDALPVTLDLAAFQNRQGFAQFGMAGHDVKFSVDTFEVVEEGASSEGPSSVGSAAPKPRSFDFAKNGDFTVTWQVNPGVTYELATSNNLESWSVAAETSSDDGVVSHTFPSSNEGASSIFISIRKKE